MAPRRLLARPGQVEKLLTLDGVLGLFGELSIFLRLAAKVVDVLHTMVSHLSGDARGHPPGQTQYDTQA